MNCLSVFDHFVELVLKGLTKKSDGLLELTKNCSPDQMTGFYMMGTMKLNEFV